MATFTMTLMEILENETDIGLGSYPIFDPGHRAILNQKIIDRFYMREIGYSTVQEFRLALRRHMNENMSMFNQRYESAKLEIDPLMTMRVTSMLEQDTNSTQSGMVEESTSVKVMSRSRAVDSSTPSSVLMADGDYASGLSDSIGETLTEQTGKNDNSAKGGTSSTGKNETTGFNGAQAQLLMLYRESFINVDLEVIESINQADLFMNIWANGDEFTRSQNPYGNLTHPYYPI